MLIISGVSASFSIGALSYFSADRAMRQSIQDQLVSIRETKKADVLRYFDNQRRTFSVFADQAQLADAIDTLRQGFAAEDQATSPALVASLQDWYRAKFLPQVPQGDRAPNLADFWPRTNAGVRLQQAFVAANPNAAGKKYMFGLNGEQADDVAAYSAAHNRYHAALVRAMNTMKLYDIFVIDTQSGNIIYTVQKEADFATNLDTGPYRNSGLAQAYRLARDGKVDESGVVLVDFSHYAASFGAPSAFIAAPVMVDGRVVGVVAGQLSIDALNAALTSSGRWAEEGLGKTGEVYLVGNDGTARSDSRFLIEDPKGYFKTLEELEVPASTIQAIKADHHSILNQRFATDAVRRAIAGEAGQDTIKDYRHENVLSAFAPLDIAGMRWAIIAEKDVAEAMEPVSTLRQHVFLASGIIAILITLFSMLASRYFLGPIARLQAGVERLKAGDTRFSIPIVGTDEFEELGEAFNDMLGELDKRNQVIATKTSEYEKLLRNMLPDAVAARVSGGELMVADTYENVSIIYAAIHGLSSMMAETSARESIGLLNELVDAFDEAAERHGVEKVKTVGDAYLAACGLSTPRLDHRQRAKAFAEELLAILSRFNEAKNCQLHLQVGLSVGEVDAGIVGRKRFVYEILGECVVEARRLALGDDRPGIHFSASMAEALDTSDATAAGGRLAPPARS